MKREHYLPGGAPSLPVVRQGELYFAATHFEHGHIQLMIEGLVKAGATLKYVHDVDSERLASVCERHTGCRVATLEEVLNDSEVSLVVSAAVPSERADLGVRVMEAGKDYLTAKPALTSREQLLAVRRAVERTGRKYAVFYSERLHNEATFHAGELLRSGALGSVLSILILAPHSLHAESRPGWFFDRQRSGGILNDLGSHQFEQFLHFCSAEGATVDFARVANLANPERPGFEDFGEARITLSNGASGHCRVDWLSPAGLDSWGDGRAFVLASGGTLEIRKNLDLGGSTPGDVIYLVDERDTHVIPCSGRVGHPFFPRFVLDVLNRSEVAMPQEHAFAAAQLALEAQAVADRARSEGS